MTTDPVRVKYSKLQKELNAIGVEFLMVIANPIQSLNGPGYVKPLFLSRDPKFSVSVDKEQNAYLKKIGAQSKMTESLLVEKLWNALLKNKFVFAKKWSVTGYKTVAYAFDGKKFSEVPVF